MDTVGYLVEEWLDNLDDAKVLQVAGVSRDDDNVSKEMLKKLHLEEVSIYNDFVEWNDVIDDFRAGAFFQ